MHVESPRIRFWRVSNWVRLFWSDRSGGLRDAGATSIPATFLQVTVNI